MLEAAGGPGAIIRPAFNFLNEDNHCEVLKYTCADVSGYWGPKQQEKAPAPNVQVKVRLASRPCASV